MSGRSDIPEKVKADQRRASAPAGSAWLRANAGSGKTYVLAQRVLRLLLDGTDPARILCITYTKAAAAEMSNRVFAWLAGWATMAEADLADELHGLQGRPATEGERLRARRLFATAIETPGRLRVQTIHAFCERLLQQFAFEASVTAGFEVVDERAAAELLSEARADLLQAMAGPEAHLLPDLERLAAEAGDEALASVLGSVVSRKGELRRWIQLAGNLDAALVELASGLGLAPGEDEAGILDAILDGDVLRRSEWETVAAALDEGGTSDKRSAGRLRRAFEAGVPDGLDDYLAVFFTDAGKPRKSVATQAVCRAEPQLAERLTEEQARLEPLRDKLAAARIAASTGSLLRVGDAVIQRYERLKGARGLLDYDDLIDRAATLLTRADAAWVLYKLDGGLDHVLVDEAQDTSPGQWTVITSVVEEFFAGRGAREGPRTLFAVGDEKQSIYSFQGAEPRRFAEIRRSFERTVRASGQPFETVDLQLSFRSTPTVLEAVDATFAAAPARIGLGYDASEPIVHEAVRRREPGLVELWPVMRPEASEPPEPWDAPFDVERPASPPARLAERIAATIEGWLKTGERLDATGEPLSAGDIMILVRNRHPFVEPMIRALKARRIPVAGADRLVLTDHIAVMDLMALARFCLMPEDDLNLAALLKSPLIGLGEDELMALAIGRQGALWEALRKRPEVAEAAERLTAWRSRAGFERPYEFFSRILGADGMRQAFHCRLGREAFEALDEFLSLALAYERLDTPTLAGFLHWLDAAPSEVKRDMEKGRDEVRVMTVHGAKGLEAPVVILPDTVRRIDARRAGPVFRLGEAPGSGLVWAPRKSDDCAVTGDLREAALERQREEEHRLLYVAMTRACDRLYVAGYQTSDTRPEGCWYDLIAGALRDRMNEATDAQGESVLRLVSDLPATEPRAAGNPLPPTLSLPSWAASAAPAEAVARGAAPSHLVDHTPGPGRTPAQDLPQRREARRRGELIHRLLERLPDIPSPRRHAAGLGALEALAPDWDEAARLAALDEVLAVLNDPTFGAVFEPSARAEAAIAGALDGIEAPVVGQIDRLHIGAATVLVVDYKTDRAMPESPDEVSAAYLAQLAAYAVLAGRLHPDKPLRAAILWTALPRLMELPPGLLAMHGGPACS